jgi:hypothetical protein
MVIGAEIASVVFLQRIDSLQVVTQVGVNVVRRRAVLLLPS